MASLLEMLRKKDPGISLEDARKIIGVNDDDSVPQFDALGNIVPKTDDETVTPPVQTSPQLESPMEEEVPATPQIFNDDYAKELAAKSDEDEQEEPSKNDEDETGKVADEQADTVGSSSASSVTPATTTSKDKTDNSAALVQAAKAAMSAQSPQAPIPTNMGLPTEATHENIVNAQAAAKRAQDAALYGKIGAQIGAGLGRYSPEVTNQTDKLMDTVAQVGTLQEQQLVDRIAFEKQDPNSQQSVATRDFLKKTFGTNLPDTVSAADIDKTFMSPALKSFEADQQRQAKNAIVSAQLNSREGIAEDNRLARQESARQANMNAQLKMQDMKQRQMDITQRSKDALEQKQNLDVDHRTDKIVAKAQENVASGRSAFGISARNLQGVQNAEALLNGQDVNTLDNREVYETAKVLDRILSQGNPSISGSAKLTPDTAMAQLAKWKEYITNQRQSANAGSFLDRTKQTLAREKAVAQKQINSTITDMFAGSRDLMDNPRSQQRIMDVLESKGIDPGSLVFNKGKISQKTPESAAPATSNKIHVTNGSEVLEIDPKDLADATKSGYQQVEQ